MISGDANEIAVASDSGKRWSAAKLRNIPHTLIEPRPTWPSGRAVESAEPSPPPRQQDHHRDDGEGRAEEHRLAKGDVIADEAHQRRHQRKEQRRDQLENNGLEYIHLGRKRMIVKFWFHFFSGCLGPSTAGSDLI